MKTKVAVISLVNAIECNQNIIDHFAAFKKVLLGYN